MHIERLTVGPAAANCYLLINEETRQALVIDPGDEAGMIRGAIAGLGAAVAAYPLTHGHVDHVSALAEVNRVHPAPVALHPADRDWAFSPRNQLPPFYGIPAPPPAIERDLADGQRWTDAGFDYQVIHTPGHTPGGVCFLFPAENLLISGDTLFNGSIGRTDLPGGDLSVLRHSLCRLLALPPTLRVLPGHGPETTLADERRDNPFLQGLAPAPGGGSEP